MRTERATVRRFLLAIAFAAVLAHGPAAAFPPYRSTDAGTAEPWTLEARLGLFRIERERSETEYLSPLLRANLGLPPNLEVVSEFQYRADEEEVDDAALGLKWIPLLGEVSAGVETLALLPNAEGNGPGVESLLLVTGRHDRLRVHVNAGGFYDPRPEDTESGWKAGSILEIRFDRFRPGLEIFAKDSNAREAQVIAGPGLIFDAGAFDVRAGIHFGLTRSAVDSSSSLWLTTAVPLGTRPSEER
ncbi:MAG: hypothetical protein ACREQ9_08975 [Candidatus Binatia bacterium]